MKKTGLIITIILCMMLTACSAGKAQEFQAQKIYDEILKLEGIPTMTIVPSGKAYVFFGIEEKDCAQAITAICSDSLRADEIWLIQATDSAAADRIEALANSRMELKAKEAQSYSPEQYEIILHGGVRRQGNVVILFVSPQVEKFFEIFENAMA